MATLKAFIFDLDGVIADTTKLHFKAWQRIAQSLEIEVSEAHNEQLKGLSRKVSLNKILAWGNLTIPHAQKEALMRKKKRMVFGAP
jgi:beta-phosphoglucomutase